MEAGALTFYFLTSSIIYRCSSWQTSYCPHLLTQRHSAPQLNINHHHAKQVLDVHTELKLDNMMKCVVLTSIAFILEKASNLYAIEINNILLMDIKSKLNQNTHHAPGMNPYVLTLADERGESGFVMKSELELTTKRLNPLTQTEKEGGSHCYFSPHLCVLCFESDFKAMWGWKSPCCMGGKLLLYLLATLRHTAHLRTRQKMLNRESIFVFSV